MVEFQEGFVSQKQASSRSAECTRIFLQQLLADSEYVELQKRKARSKLKFQAAIALSLVCLVAIGVCVSYAQLALSPPVEDIGLGHAQAAAPTSTSDLPRLSQAGHGLHTTVSAAQRLVLADNEDSSPLPDSPVDSCAEREAHLVDIDEDTDTSADSDSLADSELLAGPDPADEHLEFELVTQQGYHECSFADALGILELPVMPTGPEGLTIHPVDIKDHLSYQITLDLSEVSPLDGDSKIDQGWQPAPVVEDVVGILDLPVMPTGHEGSHILSDVDTEDHLSYHIRLDLNEVQHLDGDSKFDQGWQPSPVVGGACLVAVLLTVLVLLLVGQKCSGLPNPLTQAHSALQAASAMLVVNVTMQPTKHEQQQPLAQQPRYNSAPHTLLDGSSEDLLGVPQDSSHQSTDQAWSLMAKGPQAAGGGGVPDGWQVTAYRGPQGTTAGAGTMLPLATAGVTSQLHAMATAAIQVMLGSADLATAVVVPAALSRLVTRLSRSVSEHKAACGVSVQLQAGAYVWQITTIRNVVNMEYTMSLNARESKVLRVVVLALRDLAFSPSSSGSFMLIGSSGGLIGILHTPTGSKVAVVGTSSALTNRASLPAQLLCQTTTRSYSRIDARGGSPSSPVAVLRRHAIRSPSLETPIHLLQWLVYSQFRRVHELQWTVNHQAMQLRPYAGGPLQSRVSTSSRCEAQVQTDKAEGGSKQGQANAAQAGVVADLQEQREKLEASLASEHAATMAAGSRCAELRAAVKFERRASLLLKQRLQSAQAMTSAAQYAELDCRREAQCKYARAEFRYREASQLKLTAEQQTVRAEELSSQGASQVADAEIRAGQLDFREAALNSRNWDSLVKMNGVQELQRQCKQHAQLLEDRQKEVQQLRSRRKEQLEQLAKQQVELIAREQKLAADTNEQKEKLKKVTKDLEDWGKELEAQKLSDQKAADQLPAKHVRECATLAEEIKAIKAVKEQNEGKWKSASQKLKAEVQRLSADLKTQEQQFQHQLAEKESEHVRQLQQQHHDLVGPSRQLETDSMAALLTSHGLDATAAAEVATELRKMHDETELKKQHMSQQLEGERQLMLQQLSAERQLMLQQLSAEKQRIAELVDDELADKDDELANAEADCEDQIYNACADAQRAKNAQSAAEAGKAAAEAAKTAAESAKATAEAAAATAVSAKAQADQDKATAESALAAAESARAQAEAAKTTAEFAAAAAETAKAQALQEKATAEAAQAQAETATQLAKQEAASMKKSYAKDKADWKAVAGAKQQAEEARHAKKLVEQLQKDLKQMKVEHAVQEKQQHQAHEAVLREVCLSVAQAREAERTATGKVVAYEQSKQQAECAAAAAAAAAAKARDGEKAAQQSLLGQASCRAADKKQFEEQLSQVSQAAEAKLAEAQRLMLDHHVKEQELSEKLAHVKKLAAETAAEREASSHAGSVVILADRQRQIQEQMEATDNANKKRKTRDVSH